MRNQRVKRTIISLIRSYWLREKTQFQTPEAQEYFEKDLERVYRTLENNIGKLEDREVLQYEQAASLLRIKIERYQRLNEKIEQKYNELLTINKELKQDNDRLKQQNCKLQNDIKDIQNLQMRMSIILSKIAKRTSGEE